MWCVRWSTPRMYISLSLSLSLSISLSPFQMFECLQQVFTYFMVTFCVVMGILVVARCLDVPARGRRPWFIRLRLRRVWCWRRASTMPPPLPPPPAPPPPPGPLSPTPLRAHLLPTHLLPTPPGFQAAAATPATAVTSSKKRKW